MPLAKTFYDEHPFFWIEEYGPEEIDAVISPLLLETLNRIPPDTFALDVGCGPGRVISALKKRDIRCVGVDLSTVSLGIMRERTGQPGVAGNNLQLPLADECADLVISDGVIHHTPDPHQSFRENARLVRRGGRMYLAVYKPDHKYVSLYRNPGAFIRRAVRNPLGKAFVHSTFLPLYFMLHRIKYGSKKTWKGVENLFYDYFVTPQVVFISRDEIEEWCRECGLKVAQYDPHPTDKIHCFVLEKAG